MNMFFRYIVERGIKHHTPPFLDSPLPNVLTERQDDHHRRKVIQILENLLNSNNTWISIGWSLFGCYSYKKKLKK
jgi:hypothetical protein